MHEVPEENSAWELALQKVLGQQPEGEVFQVRYDRTGEGVDHGIEGEGDMIEEN